MPYQYFMAGENKPKRKRVMQLNTLGPGKRRALVPPSSVLTISGMSCQRGTALCPLPLGCGPQIIKEINKTKMASTGQRHLGMVLLWVPGIFPSSLNQGYHPAFIPGLVSKTTVPPCPGGAMCRNSLCWCCKSWLEHVPAGPQLSPPFWCSQQINLSPRALWNFKPESEKWASSCW